MTAKKKKPRIVDHRRRVVPRIIDHTPVVFQWPRCESAITSDSTISWRARNQRQQAKADRLGVELFQCFMQATYEIDGHWYCRKHAGLLSLDMLAEDAE
jgi:hypothetical protein